MRDFNYYPHLQDPSARERLCETIRSFWEDEIRGDYDGGKDCTSNPIFGSGGS